MNLVWLICWRPMGYHLLNFFEISGRKFRSSAAKLRPKDNIGKFPRGPVFVAAFDATVRRCAGKTSFFACFLAPLVEVCTIRRHFRAALIRACRSKGGREMAMQCWPSGVGSLVQYRPEAFEGAVPKAPCRAAISVVLTTIYSITETMPIIYIMCYQSHASLTPL